MLHAKRAWGVVSCGEGLAFHVNCVLSCPKDRLFHREGSPPGFSFLTVQIITGFSQAWGEHPYP